MRNRSKFWVALAAAAPVLLGLWMHAASAADWQSTVSVSIGMTAEQLRRGSSYPFKVTSNLNEAGGGMAYALPQASLMWTITAPYDLDFHYRGHELREANIGGENFMTAISTSDRDRVINHLQITFQNRPLTLDEALSTAKRLDDWFVAQGAHLRSPNGPQQGRAASPFFIEEQERNAPKFVPIIRNYEDARAAFLDPEAKIIGMTPFDLETDDIYVSLVIDNARRKREDFSNQKVEQDLSEEKEYFLDLSISARPTDRFK